MNIEIVKKVNNKACELTQKHYYDVAALMILDLLKTHSVQELNIAEHADIWWVFCEKIADNLSSKDSTLRLSLYQLAGESFAKEGSLATGSGEGLSSQNNIQRINAKIKVLSGLG